MPVEDAEQRDEPEQSQRPEQRYRHDDQVEEVLPDIDREHLTRAYGRGRAATITGIHDPEDDPRPTDEAVRGRVQRIFSVTCGMRSDRARPGRLEPVPESAAYEDRRAMQRGEGFDLPDDRHWCGYVVELEPTMPDDE